MTLEQPHAENHGEMALGKFLGDRNVVVFQHLVANPVLSTINAAIASKQAKPAAEAAVAGWLAATLARFDDVASHIKLVYLFLTEGTYATVERRFLGQGQERQIIELGEAWVKTAGRDYDVIFAGQDQMAELLPRIELALGEGLDQYVRPGGYDSPKLCFAILQLARVPYAHAEMIMRLDDDVTPNDAGIRALKTRYFKLVTKSGDRDFIFSWNYESMALPTSLTPAMSDEVFLHYLNTYSIRLGFMAGDSVPCVWSEDRRDGPGFVSAPGVVPAGKDADETPASLNLVHAKYLIDLFKVGKWGSNLSDPISGAGLVFNGEALKAFGPWCDSEELVSWIDDYIVVLTKQKADDAEQEPDDEERGRKVEMLSGEPGTGFSQDRLPDRGFLSVGDVLWHVNTYLDRLLMGFALAYCIDPERFGAGPGPRGVRDLLAHQREGTARLEWDDGLRDALSSGATEHVRKVLCDWLNAFCADAPGSKRSPGYFHPLGVPERSAGAPARDQSLQKPPKPPTGFVPASAQAPLNAYAIQRLREIATDSFKLVERVLAVIDRHLDTHFRFWPAIVREVDAEQKSFEDSRPSSPGWLFRKLDGIVAQGPIPTRKSHASVALITRGPEAPEGPWLFQWNSTHSVMNLIAGHIEGGEGPLVCMIRELHEELFDDLAQLPSESGGISRCEDMANALRGRDYYDNKADGGSGWEDGFIQSVKPHETAAISFVDYSVGRKQWTRYEFHVYDVLLTEAGLERAEGISPFYGPDKRTTPKAPNEWVSIDSSSVGLGFTPMGRPIGDVAKRILRELGMTVDRAQRSLQPA